MKQILFLIFTFLIFSTLALTQTKISSPLMMLPRGVRSGENGKQNHADILNSTRSQEERTDSAVFSEKSEDLSITSHAAENVDEFFVNLKKNQIELIASRIKSLKNDYPNEMNLIALLESYFHEYEQILETGTFDKWRNEKLLKIAYELELNEKSAPAPFSINIQKCALNSLCCEQNILDALLSNPVQLEQAQDSYSIRAIHLASKNAFEDAQRYFEEHNQCLAAIREYEIADLERSQSRKKYYTEKTNYYAIKEYMESSSWLHRREQREPSPWLDKSKLQNLFEIGLLAKRKFETCKTKITSTYRSVEEAKGFKKQHRDASNALSKSGIYLTQKAQSLERVLKKNKLEPEEAHCYHNLDTIFDHLAEDHQRLAIAIIDQNQTLIDHLQSLISISTKAKSAIEESLDFFDPLKQKKIDQQFIKSLPLLQEASQYFLLAYHILKNEPSSLLSKELSDRGVDFMNTALIVQIPQIPDEQREYYPPNLLATLDAAANHAENVIRETNDKMRFYHAKIANFLYEKIYALNHVFEISSLKQTVQSQSHSFFLLEKVSSTFEQSCGPFQELSELPLDQLNSEKARSLLQASFDLKNQATNLLSQIKNLLFPTYNSSSILQNEDLLSLSD